MATTKQPSILHRAAIALGVFRNGYPRAVKQAPFYFPTWRTGNPQWQIIDFASYVTDGFQRNSLIYEALMYKVKSTWIAPLRAYSGDVDHPQALPLDHPLAALVYRPNSYQSTGQPMGLNTVYLNISGNSYVMLDRPNKNALPEKMYPLRPDRVWIIPGDRDIKGYLYVPEGRSPRDGVPILPEDMIHIRLPNPGDPLEGMGYGLSPFAPMSRSADVDNAITDYLKVFFQREAAPNLYLKFDVPMDDTTIAQVKHRFMEIYGGYEKWTEPGVMDQGGEIKTFGQDFKQMAFQELDYRNESRITGPFGVPLTVLNTLAGMSGSTYNNKEQDRRIFWEDHMLPELGLHESEYQFYLRSDDGAFVAFDTRRVPALRKDRAALAAAYVALVSGGGGISPNQAAAYLDMDFGEIVNGDTVYMPLNLIPMGSKPATQAVTNESAVPDATNPETQAKARQLKAGYTPEQKAALWKANDTTATKWEPRFSDAAIRAFDKDKREVLALVNDAKTKAKELKASIAWQDSFLSVKDYIESAGEENWRSTFAPIMQGVITDQGKRWAADLGMKFDVRNFFAEDWFDEYTLKFAQEINTTTLDELGTMFKQAQAEGWSVPEMQKHLTTMFDQWSKGDISDEEFEWYEKRKPPYRTETIARTETIRSSNAGTQELFQEWGVKEHEWLSTEDTRTRDAHLKVNIDPRVVPIDEPFIVMGEKLMYPGDPNGSPENTINCVIGDTLVLPIGSIQASSDREYNGIVLEMTTARGLHLTVTPNHPILTRNGFIAAQCLSQGDDVIDGFFAESGSFFRKPNIDHRPASIEEIYCALSIAFVSQRVVGGPMNFHGDGLNGDVNIITTDRILSNGITAAPLERRQDSFLLGPDLPGLELITNSATLSSNLDGFGRVTLDRSDDMGSASIGASLRGSHLIHPDPVSVASVARNDSGFEQARSNGGSGEFENIRQLLFTYAAQIHFDKIVSINVSSFAGHVYNLQTESGMFIANGIITHNCRCTILPVME